MKKLYIIIAVVILSSCKGCRESLIPIEADDEVEDVTDLSSYPDWSEETHGDFTGPNYAAVFNQEDVLRFDIKISNSQWELMQDDLSNIVGSNIGAPPGGPATNMADQNGLPAGVPPPGGTPPAGNLPGITDSNPVWVECNVQFNDINWYHVGIRFKGNSSLRKAYQDGNNKLSFKLDFDEFEDDYPALKNQRFYGFRQLNLNNNFGDPSLMHEKVATDLFRNFGLASAHTAYCVLYIDYGEGPKYYGVYTIVEEIDDTVIEEQFSDGSGNLYKPDGAAASFAQGSYMDSQMEKKTNEDAADYSDVQELYDAINNSTRDTLTESWKEKLEAVFDVNTYLKWLAANTVMQNWDTYGKMTHNYYLYNNPENGLLTWIPWDNNEALNEGKQDGALSLSLKEVGDDWPLISYIIDNEDYRNIYNIFLSKFITDVFNAENMVPLYEKYEQLIQQYAYQEQPGTTFILNNAAFDQAVIDLKKHVSNRNDAVINYLADYQFDINN